MPPPPPQGQPKLSGGAEVLKETQSPQRLQEQLSDLETFILLPAAHGESNRCSFGD